MSALPFLLSVVVTSTAATSSVSPSAPDVEAPGAARLEPKPAPVEPPSRNPFGSASTGSAESRPAPHAERARVAAVDAPSPFPERVRTHELGLKLAAQGDGYFIRRTLGFELSYGHWFGERLGADVRAAYFPPAGAFGGSGEIAAGYLFANGRWAIGRGPGHVVGRWDTMFSVYLVAGAGAVARAAQSTLIRRDDMRFVPAVHGGVGLQLELFGPHVALTVELLDAFQPGDDVGHELRALGGVAIAIDAGAFDAKPHSEAPSEAFDGVRFGALVSNTVAPGPEDAKGLALTLTKSLGEVLHLEAYVAYFLDPEDFDPDPALNPFVPAIDDGLRGAATIGLQVDLVRARAEAPIGDGPMQLRLYGVAAVGGGLPRRSGTLHVVGALGVGCEVAFASGPFVAIDVRDLLYEEGADNAHLRTGLGLGWRW